MKFEIKPLVGASLSESAVEEVNEAMAELVKEDMTAKGSLAKMALQRHLFELVPTKPVELEEP